MKTLLPLVALTSLLLVGCGSKDSSGAPLDTNRPPSPAAPSTATGNPLSAPPPAAAPGGTPAPAPAGN